MNKIVLYCKSYRGDIDRVDRLIQSINEFNIDRIPVFISCPKADLDLFKSKQWANVNLISDEEIDPNNLGWHGQQIVKAQFWKLGVCENYLCLDSDSQFIKPFYISDFMYTDDIPYTVLHEDKELLEWSQKAGFPFDVQESSERDREAVMSVFNRKGVFYDFGPSPVIWSSKVWRSLFENYIDPNNLTFVDLIKHCSSEFTWYGEWLLVDKTIPLYPRQPLFKVFHYAEQYIDHKNKNYSLDDIKRLYLGIILQSNWNAPIMY